MNTREQEIWAEACRLEPRLRKLVDGLTVIDDRERADARWYGSDGAEGVKTQMVTILSRDPSGRQLSGEFLYEVVYEACYQALSGHDTAGNPVQPAPSTKSRSPSR